MALIRAQVYSQRHPGPNKFVVEPAYAGFLKRVKIPSASAGRAGNDKKRRVFPRLVT